MDSETHRLSFKTTVAILTKNQGQRLSRCVRGVLAQRTTSPFEVLVVDSSSTDGSLDALEGMRVRRIIIPSGAFNHGATRNLAVQAARGHLVAFLVADAVPIGRFWLQHLISALETHPEAAGAYGRQRAWPDADPALKRRLDDWTPPGKTLKVKRILSPEHFRRLAPEERIRVAAFDNVNSIVRRNLAIAHPFPETPFGEDLLWGRDRLLEGHAIVYAPTAEVWHSHRRHPIDHLRRARQEHAMLYREFGLLAVPGITTLAMRLAGILRHGHREGATGATRLAAEAAGQYLARFA